MIKLNKLKLKELEKEKRTRQLINDNDNNCNNLPTNRKSNKIKVKPINHTSSSTPTTGQTPLASSSSADMPLRRSSTLPILSSSTSLAPHTESSHMQGSHSHVHTEEHGHEVPEAEEAPVVQVGVWEDKDLKEFLNSMTKREACEVADAERDF